MNDMAIPRVVRSVRKRGWLATGVLFVEAYRHELRRPRRWKEHLLVPREVLRNPRHARAWFRDRCKTQGAIRQGVPWISWPCIDYLSSYLRPGHKVFEWGGGGSTMFFLAKDCFLTTVESNEFWRQQLEERIPSARRDRWQLRLLPSDSNEDPRVELYIASVLDGAPWDVVLVDGWRRRTCVLRARATVRPGGLLVVDNADHPQFAGLPELMHGWERLEFRGLGPARTWVTQTDVYVKRNQS